MFMDASLFLTPKLILRHFLWVKTRPTNLIFGKSSY